MTPLLQVDDLVKHYRLPREHVLAPPQRIHALQGVSFTLDAGRSQGWFVVHLNEVIKGDASKNAELVAARRQEMLGLLQQEYAAQLINAARAEVGVSKNDSAIKDIRRRLTNQDAAQ